MSYKFRVVQNKIQGSPSFNKWFAKTVTLGNVSTEELCQEISHSTTVTESDVRAVFAELKVKLRDHLLLNQSVKVDGLGTFNVRLKSSASDQEKDVDANKIKWYGVGFLPESQTVSTIQDKDGNAHKVRGKKLLEGITFDKLPYDTAKNFVKRGLTPGSKIDENGNIVADDKTDTGNTEG